jgi:hypothetical protein
MIEQTTAAEIAELEQACFEIIEGRTSLVESASSRPGLSDQCGQCRLSG